MPDFFSYNKHIVAELTNMGYEVDYFSDRPDSNIIIKSLIRLNKKIVSGRIRKYENKILDAIKKNKYEKMIMIFGQSFDVSFVEKAKTINPAMELIYYAWDSIKLFPDIEKLSACFGKSFTSDLNDSLNVPHLHFLPLFYSRMYEAVGKEPRENCSYDALFVGTIKNGKYKPLKALLKSLERLFKNNYVYLYLQSKLVFLYSKMKYKDFKGSKLNEFHYKKMPESELAALFAKSKFVIDILAGDQNSLTMRTIEALGAKRKLITTNKEIEKYDFFNPTNIYIYEENGEVDLKAPFFTEEYKGLDKTIYEKYSLRAWLKTILGDDK